MVGQRHKRFSVAQARLKAGQALTAQNDDVRDHNVRYGLQGREYNSGVQEPGQTITVPFAEPGDYHVYCGIHPKMKLHVQVER